jgi:putative membrane protein
LSQLKQGRTSAAGAFAAIDVTRPLPFTAWPRPAPGDLAKDLLRKRDSDE